MRTLRKSMLVLGSAAAVGGLVAAAAPPGARASCAPCRPKAASPCTAKGNPCAAVNPCAAKANPCAAAAADPCAAKALAAKVTRPEGRMLQVGDTARGEALYADASLSTNGLSCLSCHQGGGAFLDTFAQAYPHRVAMAWDRAGMAQVDIDEMIQLCMVEPMQAKPLPWDGQALADLAAYTQTLQADFQSAAMTGSPCAAANPCAAKGNPCAANPCAAVANPCAVSASPCAAKANPGAAKPNPCAAATPCAANPATAR